MLLSTIRQAITDIYTSETFPTTKLNRFIAQAVDFYSRYNPIPTEYSFTTVQDDNNYDMPAGCIGIQKVLYPAITVSNSSANYGSDFIRLQQSGLYNEPSLYVIMDINEGAYVDQYKGHYEYRQVGNDLVIDPTPSAGTTVNVIYWKKHTLNVGGTGYDNIPDEDLEIIAALTLAHIMEMKAIEASMEPDTKEGLEEIRVHFIQGTAYATVDNLRAKVTEKYGAGSAISTVPS